MRFTLQFLFILVLAYVLALFLPWYSVAAAAFLGGVLVRSKANFLAGFVAVGMLWLIKAILADSGDTNDLATRVAGIFTLPAKELLYLVMIVIGGLVGGLGCLCGSMLFRARE